MKKSIEEHWNKDADIHQGYKAPSYFSRIALGYIEKNELHSILEIGSGVGRDTSYFYNHGLEITALDISSRMLRDISEKLPNLKTIHADVRDALEKLPEKSFDCVYARLSLHYFNNTDTQNIFDRIFKTLTNNGYLFAEVRSTKDPKYNKGKKLEEFLLENSYGGFSHFFTEEALKGFSKNFDMVSLEEISSIDSDGQQSFSLGLIVKKR